MCMATISPVNDQVYRHKKSGLLYHGLKHHPTLVRRGMGRFYDKDERFELVSDQPPSSNMSNKKIKVTVRIPGWGVSIYDVDSIESELKILREKFSHVAEDIRVEPHVVKRYSDDELAAMEKSEPADEDDDESED